jgi:hypothetical protein
MLKLPQEWNGEFWMGWMDAPRNGLQLGVGGSQLAVVFQ